MATFNTQPYRKAMYAYAKNHELVVPDGYNPTGRLPLGKPARKLLKHIQQHLVARKDQGFTEHDVDGTLNTKTKNYLVPKLTLGDKAVRLAMKEVGVHENPWGTNRGARVHFYQSSTGEYNVAWCASFVCKMWQLAGYKGPTSAGAWHLTDNIGTPVDLAHAKPGDAVSFNVGEGHVGIYLSHTASLVKSVDGNTSDQVAVRERPVELIHGICRVH